MGLGGGSVPSPQLPSAPPPIAAQLPSPSSLPGAKLGAMPDLGGTLLTGAAVGQRPRTALKTKLGQ
jgi:hypothetical protein